MLNRLYIAIPLSAVITSGLLAAQPIVVSDGPNGSSSNTKSSHPNIVTTDGPTQLPYSYPPKIIISDGPSTLPYQYPPKLATTDGPGQLPNNSPSKSQGLIISDGPGTTRLLAPNTKQAQQSQKVRKVIAKKHSAPRPEPEASALAPAIASQSPAPSPSPMNAAGKILAAIVAFSILAYGTLRAYRRWVSSD